MKLQAYSLNRCLAVATVLAALLVPTAALAVACPNVDTVPKGLKPGATYYLAIVTTEKRDSLSDKIADYNKFVTQQAEQCDKLKKLNTTWKAIASTNKTDDAITNTGLAGALSPIYLVTGTTDNPRDARVVKQGQDLFSGRKLENQIFKDQFGLPITKDFMSWTGSYPTGKTSLFPLGNDLSKATYGDVTEITTAWIKDGRDDENNKHHLYAISEELKVPEKKDSDELTLHVSEGVSSGLALVGHPVVVTVMLEAGGRPVAGATVNLNTVLGDVRFVMPDTDLGGTELTVTTDSNGAAVTQLVARQPGLGIIQAKAGNLTARLPLSATNIAPQ